MNYAGLQNQAGLQNALYCADKPVDPKSPCDVAMSELESKVVVLEDNIARLGRDLESALRPVDPPCNEAEDHPGSDVPIIAHVYAIGVGIDHCIRRVQDLAQRLAI